MKKILWTLILIALSSPAYNQIKNIPVNNDSSLVINEVYVGMLAWNETRVDSFSNSPYATVRFGAAATWKMTKKLNFNIFGVYETGGVKPFLLTQCRFDFFPSSKWKLTVGNTATLISEQRPMPTSDGHFETWTMARIPGLAPGFKIKYMPNSSTSFGVGLALRRSKPDYQLSITHHSITAAVYYQSATKESGLAVTLNTKRYYGLLVQNRNVLANTSTYSFKTISLYNDSGYDFQDGKMVRWETGVLKNFKARTVSGLVGFGYDAKKQVLNSYLFIHL